MKKIFITFLCLFSTSIYADVYKKVDPNGHITLTNINPDDKREQASTLISAPAKASPKQALSNTFPKISESVQKDRDADRKKILEDELKAEQIALKDAIDKKQEASVIARHKENITALDREILSIK